MSYNDHYYVESDDLNREYMGGYSYKQPQKVNYHNNLYLKSNENYPTNEEYVDNEMNFQNNYENRNEYEELKNAYLSQLMSEKSLQFNPTQINTRKENLNSPRLANNPQVQSFSRPTSEKSIDKEIKRRQQEEYRTFLDSQLKEQNARKERLRLEKKGIVPPQEDVKSIISSPQIQNTNHPNSNNNEKEIEKRKKIEYQNELLRQIDERKRRAEDDKRKRREEELKYEEKYKQVEPVEVKTKGKKQMVNIQSSPNIPVNESSNPRSPKEMQIDSTRTNNQTNIINPRLSEEYLDYKEKQFKANLNTPYPNQNVQSSNHNNYHYSSARDNNLLKSREQQIPLEYESPGYSMNAFNNREAYLNPSTSHIMSGQSYQPNSARTYIPPGNQMPQMIPPFFEDMLKYFFQEQVKVINQYKGSLDRMAEERDKAIFQNVAAREKMMALNQLKLEQERFKSNMGFYPFDNNYNRNIEEMFNTMIDNNFSKTKQDIISSPTNEVRKSITEERPISGMKVDAYKKMKEEEPEVEVKYLDFRSKYEDLTQSMISLKEHFHNREEISTRESHAELQVSSKFVCAELKNEDLMTTWREDARDNSLESEINYNPKVFKAKSLNIPRITLDNNIFESHRDYAHMIISKEEKDKSLFLEEEVEEQQQPQIKQVEIDEGNEVEEFDQTCKDYMESINVDYHDDQAAYYNPDYKSNESSEYSQTFNEEQDLQVNEIKEVDLAEYKDIHEVDKLQSQLNFFETSEDNYVIKQSEVKHVVSAEMNREIQMMSRPDPKDRLPREITANNLSKLNEIYDKFNNYKKQSMNTVQDEDSQFMESIHHFNHNLRPNDYKDYKDLSRQHNSNYLKTENESSHVNIYTEGSEKNHKYNPINELNNEDSLIKDLTKFTKFALNEINQSDLFKGRNCNDSYEGRNNGKDYL